MQALWCLKSTFARNDQLHLSNLDVTLHLATQPATHYEIDLLDRPHEEKPPRTTIVLHSRRRRRCRNWWKNFRFFQKGPPGRSPDANLTVFELFSVQDVQKKKKNKNNKMERIRPDTPTAARSGRGLAQPHLEPIEILFYQPCVVSTASSSLHACFAPSPVRCVRHSTCLQLSSCFGFFFAQGRGRRGPA